MHFFFNLNDTEQKPRFTAMTYEYYDLIRPLMRMSTTVVVCTSVISVLTYPRYTSILMKIRNPR